MSSAKNILEIVVGIAILVIVASIVFLVLTQLRTTSSTTVQEANFSQYRQVAEQYKRRMFDYRGVCQELVLSSGVQCKDTEDGYRIYAGTTGQALYCVDVTGFAGTVSSVPRDSFLCR